MCCRSRTLPRQDNFLHLFRLSEVITSTFLYFCRIARVRANYRVVLLPGANSEQVGGPQEKGRENTWNWRHSHFPLQIWIHTTLLFTSGATATQPSEWGRREIAIKTRPATRRGATQGYDLYPTHVRPRFWGHVRNDSALSTTVTTSSNEHRKRRPSLRPFHSSKDLHHRLSTFHVLLRCRLMRFLGISKLLDLSLILNTLF